MLEDGGNISAAIAPEILQLSADFADCLAFPRHGWRRQSPMRIARNAGLIEVVAAVTCRASHAGSTVAILASHDQRLMQAPLVRLARPLACRMTIHAAGVLKHFGGFLE
jgi:hypothetical protein